MLVIQCFFNAVKYILRTDFMPRKPDARLEDRILNAAYKYGLTEVNTSYHACRGPGEAPPLRRFTSGSAIKTISCPLCRRERSGASSRPSNQRAPLRRLSNRYRIHDYTRSRIRVARQRLGCPPISQGSYPSFDLIKARLADQLGGSPDDHLQLALAWSRSITAPRCFYSAKAFILRPPRD